MEYADLGKTPITDDAPTGADVSGNPLYDQLSTEIKKLSSPTAEGGIDWQVIERLAVEILATRSKHILVACCLNIALQHTAGWQGFAQGVAVLRDLLLTYWENCFPVLKRMRGRVNAIVWWQEMIEARIGATEGEQWDTESRTAMLATLEEIDRFLGDTMEDAPVLRPIIQALAGHITEKITEAPPKEELIPAPAAEANRPPAAQSPPALATSSPPRQQATAAPSEDLPPEKNFARGSDYLRLVATQLLHSDPMHPLAFRLNRIVAWFPLEALPPANNGATMVPPPDAQTISQLQNLAAAGNWSDLLQAAEQQVRQSLFWLDPHRYVATALERLGRDLAREGVACEILLLIKRLPGLEKLAFSDGTPFADPATRDWLNELRTGGGAAAAQPSAPALRGGDFDEHLAKAQALAADSKLSEALQVLHHGLQTAVGGRARLQWTQAICRLVCRNQQASIAAPFATTLLEQLDRHGLEQWEPSLAEEVLVTVYQVLRLQEKDEQGGQRMQAVLNRLAVLNPVRALELL